MIKSLRINKYPLLWMFIALFCGSAFTASAQTITSMSPTTVTGTMTVTILGTNLTGSTVKFGSTSAAVVSNTATQIVVTVPTLSLGAGVTSGTVAVTVTKNSINYNAGNVTYKVPIATNANNAKVTRIHTDYQGYWTSNNITSVAAQQPDRQHSMMAFEYGGITYATGVSNTTLASKGVNYTSADFRALPVASIAGTTPSSSAASNFFAMASRMDGSATNGVPTAPEVAGRKAKDVLIDGIKGLGIGTGITNFAPSSTMEFVVTDIANSRINDAEPDIVVSQIAEPTSSASDIFYFVDTTGNLVGYPVSVQMSSIPAIGTYKLDLFNITFSTSYDAAQLTTNATSAGTRDIRLVGYKLSDFGITLANQSGVAHFRIVPSGISDPAFIAYNANSLLIPAPRFINHPVSKVACTGQGSSTTFSVNVSATNVTYQWKKNGVNLTNGGNISGATTSTLTITDITAADVAFYTCEASNAAGTVLSNAGYLNTIIAVQPADNTACLNASGPYVEVIANGLSLTYQWYSNTTGSNSGGTLIPGATSATYTPPVDALGTKYYYVVIQNNGQGCVTETSAAAKFTVGAAAVSGTAYVGGTAGTNNNSTTATVCTGGTAIVRSAGYTATGATYQWEYSIDGIAGWNSVSGGSGGTTVNYTTPALSSTTYYRLRVKTSSCEVYTNIVTVQVGIDAGTVSADQIICTGNTATVTISGSSGTIQWQQSANGTDVWANVTAGSGATTASYTTPALTETTYYRATVSGGACGSFNSNVTKVTVNAASNAGTVSANQNICSGNTATVAITGATGTVQWQQSANGTDGWIDISGANLDSYTSSALTSTAYYRAVVTSGNCTSATSGVITVTVSSATAGTAGSNQSICTGATATVAVSGATGTLQWQQSANGTDGWVTVTGGSGATTASYTTGTLTTTTYYRVRSTNGSCSATSSVITVTVSATPVAGTASSNQALCSASSTTVSVTGASGSIQWEQSADGVTNWSSVSGGSGAATASYTTPTLSSTTYYRAVVSRGACTVANSSVITVMVTPTSAGTTGGNQSICSGSTAILTTTGSTGTLQWQQSANGNNGWVNVTGGSGENATSYTTANITATTYYRVVATNGSCSSTSSTITVTVNPAPTVGTTSGGTTICPDETATLTLSAASSSIQWQQSANGSTGWVNVAGGSGAATLSYTTAALSATTYFRALVTSGACTATSNTVIITVNDTFIWNGTVNTNWHVAGNWSCNAIPTLNDNVVIPQRPNQPVVMDNVTALGKTLDVQAGAIVTVNAMRNIQILGTISVDATGDVIINSTANLVQDSAGTTNSNTGNITVKRNSSPLYRQDYTLWSTPVEGQKLFQFSPLTLANRFYTYDTNQDLYVSVPGLNAQSTTTFTTGVGYLIRMPNSNSAPDYNAGNAAIIMNQQFKGKPNNGTINVPVSLVVNRYNGIGNPYPSAINIQNFIDENNGKLDNLGTLYFWRKKNNNANTSYASITKFAYSENFADGGDTGSPFFTDGTQSQWVVNPGQGFVVRATPGTSHLTFTNTMRKTVNNSQYFRTQDQLQASKFRLNLTAATGEFNQAVIGYSNMTTDGLDYGYDGILLNDGSIAIYTSAENTNLTIQAKGGFNVSDVVPVSYRVDNAGSYTIKLKNPDGLFAGSQEIYLKDNVANVTHNIKAGDYSFTTEAGTYTNRFEVVYVNAAMGTGENTLTANNVVVFKKDGVLNISTGSVQMKDVMLFDTRGRLVHEVKGINASTATVGNIAVQEQMMIVQITTTDGVVVSKKVVY